MVDNISIIGCGKLGLAFALVCEEAGFDVVGTDINQDYVTQLNNKTFETIEPDISQMLKASTKFTATTKISEAVQHSELLFCFVATPSLRDGSYDHSCIEGIIGQLTKLHEEGIDLSRKTFIIGCTVMPKYTDTVYERLKEFGMEVCYNPEFIAQGDIVHGLKNADMVLVGTSSQTPIVHINYVYRKIMGGNTAYVNVMSNTAAEITKISLNCFLTTKISFANMIGQIAINSGVESEVQFILECIGQDKRIGNRYLKYGFGFGSVCLPRDGRALAIHADSVGINATIPKTTDEFNNAHAEFLKNYFIAKNPDKLPFIFDRITYKEGTNLIVDSQQYRLCSDLIREGYTVIIPDYHEEMISKYVDLTNLHGSRRFIFCTDDKMKINTTGIKIEF